MKKPFCTRQVISLALFLVLSSSALGQDKEIKPPANPQASDISERLARVTGAGKKTEKERDPAGYKKLQEEVERAIRRGAAWLKKQDLFFSAPVLNFREDYSTLGILTLLHAGEFERDPALAARCLDYLQRRPLKISPYATYATSLTAMALADWEAPGTGPRILECAQWLVENQGASSSPNAWGYGEEVPGIGQEKKLGFEPPEEGLPLEVVRRGLVGAKRKRDWDNSNSQFAVLGLHSAAHAGVIIPKDVWERVETHFRENQQSDGSWGYRRSAGYGSMTCSGLASSIIARYHLGREKPAADPAIVRGLEWLAEHFTVEENPKHSSDHYYFLYGLERVGVLAGTEFLGDHEWYPVGARYLLAQQEPGGYWSSKKGIPSGYSKEYLDTCYAILFLRRATLSFEPKITVKITKPTAGKKAQGHGEITALPRSSPSHPVTGVDFYLDGKKLGTVPKAPFKLAADFGPEIKTHQIRVVAHNTANQVANDELTTPATYKNATLAVFHTSSGLPPELAPVVELLLDCSGSMKDPVGGEAKYRVARRILEQVMDELPAHFQVGFRAFGHMGFWKEKTGQPADDDPRWNSDSELLIAIGQVDQKNRRKLIKDWINYLKPAGATPLVYSLLQAHKDLSGGWAGPKMVVVVSDGMETCGGKLEDVAKAYKKGGDVELAVHIVGFGVPADEEKQLQEICKQAGGKYYDARSADQLAGALREAVKTTYLVLDNNGKSEVARGQVGGAALTMPPGQYQVQLLGAKTKPLTIELQDDQRLNLILDKNGLQPYTAKTDIRNNADESSRDPQARPRDPKKKSQK